MAPRPASARRGPVRRPSALALAALAALTGCARDLEVPTTVPPRVDEVRLVVREAVPAPAGGLPVLAGQLVALRGAGFPADPALVQVQVGGVAAELVAAAPERLVVRVPALPLTGPADVSVAAPAGFRALPAAVRYDGPGQPAGVATRDLRTEVALWSLVPVEGTAASAPELALGVGASDSALLFAGGLGAAFATVPLGLVPSSAAARIGPAPGKAGTTSLEVLGIDREGRLAVGTLELDAALQVVARPPPTVTSTAFATAGCSSPQLLMARGGALAAITWQAPGGARVAALERDPASGVWALRGQAQALPGPVTSWTASASVPGQILLVAADELLAFDAAAPAVKTFEPMAGASVASILAGAPCAALGAVDRIEAVATWPWSAPSGLGRTQTERVAVAYRQAGLSWVATFDRHDPAGTLRRGLAGVSPSALALAPDVPYLADAEPSPLAASLGTLQRFARSAGPTVAGCATSLVVDAALPLGGDPLALVPPFGGLQPVSAGARLLALTPAGDVETVLPASMTSLGPAFRLAVYGGVSVSVASVEGLASTPLAVVEHGFAFLGGAAALDTGSAELLVELSGDGSPLALGGAGYGRGAAWLGDGVTGALAYAGDVPATSLLGAARGGSTAVAVFERDRCAAGAARLSGSRPV
ncbi:MAG: IPT/TIG domain-containing protein, partial [Anaeromyxobacteraceae bacterium]|nr:IPT/TIG domain-containing protein [Anaeromyxobacteraceae bacterium]